MLYNPSFSDRLDANELTGLSPHTPDSVRLPPTRHGFWGALYDSAGLCVVGCATYGRGDLCRCWPDSGSQSAGGERWLTGSVHCHVCAQRPPSFLWAVATRAVPGHRLAQALSDFRPDRRDLLTTHQPVTLTEHRS